MHFGGLPQKSIDALILVFSHAVAGQFLEILLYTEYSRKLFRYPYIPFVNISVRRANIRKISQPLNVLP